MPYKCYICSSGCEVGKMARLPRRRQEWQEWSKHNGWPDMFYLQASKKKHNICAKHFSSDCFDEHGNLKLHSFPTLLGPKTEGDTVSDSGNMAERRSFSRARCQFCSEWIDRDIGEKWMPQSGANRRSWQAANPTVPAAFFHTITRVVVCHRHFGHHCFDANGKMLKGKHIIPTKLHEGLNLNFVEQEDEGSDGAAIDPSSSHGTVARQLEGRLLEGHTSTPLKQPSARRLHPVKKDMSQERRCHFCNQWTVSNVGWKGMPRSTANQRSRSTAHLQSWQAANPNVPAASFQVIAEVRVCHRHFAADCFGANGKLLTKNNIIPTKLHEGLNLDEEEEEGDGAAIDPRQSASCLQSVEKFSQHTPPPQLSPVSNPDRVSTPSDAASSEAPPLSPQKRGYLLKDDEDTHSNEASRADLLEQVDDPDFQRLSSSGSDTTSEEGEGGEEEGGGEEGEGGEGDEEEFPNQKQSNKLNERNTMSDNDSDMDKYECALCNDGSLGTWKFPGPNDIHDASVKRNMLYFLNRISKHQKKSLMRKCGAYLCMGHFHEEDGFVNELGIYTLNNPKSAVPWYAGKENQLFKSVQEISPEEHSPTPTKRRAKRQGSEKCFLCPMLVHPFDLLDHVEKVHVYPNRTRKIARCASPSPLDCMCDLCESGGMSKRMMLTHLSRAHSSSLRKEVLKICHICDKSVESWAFTAHMDEHMVSIIRVSKDKYVYKCLVCNILFPFRQRFKNHLYEEHGYVFGSIFHCDICGYVCRIGKNIFVRHLESVHLKATTECTICGKTVAKNNIGGHTRINHSDYYKSKSKRRLCNVCGKMLCSQSTLDIHAYIHHQVMPAGHKDCACDICGSRFFIPNLLWTHIAAKHLGHTYYKWRRNNI